MNHSCRPNSEISEFQSPPEASSANSPSAGEEAISYHVGIVASRDIEPFEQLSFNYGWYDVQSPGSPGVNRVHTEARRLGKSKWRDHLREAAHNVGMGCCCGLDPTLNRGGRDACSGVIGLAP